MLKKIINLLSTYEQKKIIILIILIFIMSLIDMLGVASIFPFIALLTNPKLIETNEMLNYLYRVSSVFGINNVQQFLLMLGLVVLILLIIAFIIRLITIYAQNRFIYEREYSISKRLIEIYLNQPYIWSLSQHSANLSKNILSEVSQVINFSIYPFVQLISSSLATLALLLLLFILDPLLAVVTLLILLICYLIIFFSIKNLLKRIGSECIKANEDRFKLVTKVFGSFKEVKFSGLEKVYINIYSKYSEKYANSQSKSKITSELPKYFVEVLSLGGLIILILVLLSRGIKTELIIPMVGVYAFAGYRLLPALQQIYYSISNLRFSKPSLNLLSNEFKKLKYYEEELNHAPISITKSISLNNVFFSYPNTNRIALKKINLSIPVFSKIGILGKTGSGKTTLVDIILGLIDPSQGELIIDGNIINSKNKRSWQKCIGYVPQQIYLTDSSVAANIAFRADTSDTDYKAVEEAAKIANLHEFIINELPQSYNTLVGENGSRLSGGQRQRIGIARALYHKPQVLILDEATSSLDNLTEKSVIEEIDKLKNKITLIIISHRLITVKNCDLIFLLENGEIKDQGSYNELKERSMISEKFLEKK
jgi:ABC-type bacteriocin/lantibiotic exporter with double-glycine peptidase domain